MIFLCYWQFWLSGAQHSNVSYRLGETCSAPHSSQKNNFHFSQKNISESVLSYFDFSKRVESVLLLSPCFYLSTEREFFSKLFSHWIPPTLRSSRSSVSGKLCSSTVKPACFTLFVILALLAHWPNMSLLASRHNERKPPMSLASSETYSAHSFPPSTEHTNHQRLKQAVYPKLFQYFGQPLNPRVQTVHPCSPTVERGLAGCRN